MDWTRGSTLGHGSTATIFLATSSRSGEVFAVKSAELSQSEFLQREQKILSSIFCPYVVSYKGCDITRESNKILYNIFLEYMSSGTLADAIRAGGGRLDESVIRYYTNQIVEGIDYLHSIGLVHCDIKSRNILIGSSGAKIADFGCAKLVADVTAPIGGTPLFMAPEVTRGEEQGFASDIWSLGCTVIEMATGGSPWPNASDPVSVMYRIGHSGESPEFPSCLSEEARDFLDKCLRRDPKERWTSSELLRHPFVKEFNSEVKQIQQSISPTSILDQGFWNTLDEPETILKSQVCTSVEKSAGERIGRLSWNSWGPSWDLDESWMTIREGYSEGDDAVIDDIEAKHDMMISYGLLVEKESHFGKEKLLDSSNFVNSRIRAGFLQGCNYGKDSCVNSSLLIDSSSRLMLKA